MTDNLIEEAFAKLEENIWADDLYLSDYQQELTEALEKNGDPEKYVRRLFGLFEKYPDADWGMPGEIVNYLEMQDNDLFERELLASVERRPVYHTLWMLNRQCNGKQTKEEIEKICGIFQKTIGENSSDKAVVSAAEDYVKYQNERIAKLG